MVNTTAFLNTVKTGVRATVIAEGTYMAVGTDNTTPAVSDTTLGAEEERNSRQEYTEGTSDIVLSLFVNSTEANSTSLKEVGVFDASSSGNMAMRDIFTAIAKTSSIEVWIDVEQQIDVTQ